MSNRFLVVCGGSGVNLLGQRQILGFDAEMQIDVSSEVDAAKRRRLGDTHSFAVSLDRQVGVTVALLQDLLELAREGRKADEGYVPEFLSFPEDIAHLRFLADHTYAMDLEYGLAQSPAIGKAAIFHPKNRNALRQEIGRMLSKAGTSQLHGSDNPVEVWIIASTAGGTGEGTHRYVGATIADIVSSQFTDTPVKLNFVRVGQGTYNSVGRRQTALNTFFGVAADIAFTLQAKKFFPYVTTNWFYFDLPDVGTGKKAKALRAEMVEMAAKAILLKDLQEDLQKLLVNNGGAPVVVSRTGFWGRDFDDTQKYYETLRQLISKLRDLVEPDYANLISEGELPRFVSTGLEAEMKKVTDPNYLLSKKDGGWAFPRYKGRFPEKLGEMRDAFRQWERSMGDLIGKDVSEIEAEYIVSETTSTGEGEERKQEVRLRVPAKLEEGERWYEEVQSVHRALAWARHLLGISFDGKEIKPNGLIGDLYRKAQEISKIWHGFSPFAGVEKRAREAAPLMGEFLELMVKVRYLYEVEEYAKHLLETELREVKDVLTIAVDEMRAVKNVVGGGASVSAVEAAELSTVLDQLTGQTWLQMLKSAVKRGDRERFREVVLRGAIGLTEAGLRSVLGLSDRGEMSEVHQVLTASVGRMLDAEGESHEAPWWGANAPNDYTLKYEYRILPKLKRELRQRLMHQQDMSASDFRYVFTEMGTIGLYVLAFVGVSLNQAAGDFVSAPAYLMRPFVEVVRGSLSDRWVDNPEPNTPSGQLEIVRAGAFGEPLYRRALEEVGLSSEEIEKISQFYRLVE